MKLCRANTNEPHCHCKYEHDVNTQILLKLIYFQRYMCKEKLKKLNAIEKLYGTC